VVALTVAAIKPPSSVVVADLVGALEELVGGWATVAAAAGSEAIWSMQVQ
jgi:hypothetical protein